MSFYSHPACSNSHTRSAKQLLALQLFPFQLLWNLSLPEICGLYYTKVVGSRQPFLAITDHLCPSPSYMLYVSWPTGSLCWRPERTNDTLATFAPCSPMHSSCNTVFLSMLMGLHCINVTMLSKGERLSVSLNGLPIKGFYGDSKNLVSHVHIILFKLSAQMGQGNNSRCLQ